MVGLNPTLNEVFRIYATKITKAYFEYEVSFYSFCDQEQHDDQSNTKI